MLNRPVKIRTRSLSQERTIAREVNGTTTPGSGARWHSKGDVKSKEYLIEAKRTDKQQYTIKKDELLKITMEAHQEGKEPVLAIEIGSTRYALIPWRLFLQFSKENE